ncbi:MAG: hypothetical protein N3D18_01060 [Roseococcus sp.]|nr:hypothetical protein [Roseococcus sp.]
MRVLKPLTLARRRQLCGTPLPQAARSSRPVRSAEPAEILDLREERRAFAEPDATPAPERPPAE